MNTDKNIARTVGVLFIVATVAGVLSVVVTGPILNSPDYLMKISTNESQWITGSLFAFIMGVAGAGIGIGLYPILKKYNEGLALWSAGFRIMEGVFIIVGVVALTLLLALSQEFVKVGAPDPSYFQTMGALLIIGQDWVSNVAVLLAWCIGALAYYYVFYQVNLMPRWLSGWGLVGITLTIVSSLLIMFHLISPTIQAASNLPIALQEMVMAVWLIVKGFNQEASTTKTA
jgi:Domain of unknown function (DUF4386)